MAHSAILGGSNAERLLNCNASYQLGLKAPVADVPSVYAAEGTMLHDYAADCARKGLDPSHWHLLPGHLTTEHVELIAKARASIGRLMDRYGGKWRVVMVEQRHGFPGVAGSFGTLDLAISNGSTIILIDYKFGGGVLVRALYDDGKNAYLNPQLVYYAICARAARRQLFRNKAIVLAIIQPRVEGELDYTATTNDELDEWTGHLTQAYLNALDRNPEAVRGNWCQFCIAKPYCPEWLEPLRDLYDLDLPGAALRAAAERKPDKYGVFLGRALTLSRFAEQWGTEIQRQAHLYASEGGAIPGWRLVPKRANRSWSQSEMDTVRALTAIGMPEPELYSEPELLSPAQAEKALRKRKLALPDGLVVSISSGTTLAPADDPRPTVTHVGALAELGEALEALK